MQAQVVLQPQLSIYMLKSYDHDSHRIAEDESLALGMEFGKIDKVNFNIYVLPQCI